MGEFDMVIRKWVVSYKNGDFWWSLWKKYESGVYHFRHCWALEEGFEVPMAIVLWLNQPFGGF